MDDLELVEVLHRTHVSTVEHRRLGQRDVVVKKARVDKRFVRQCERLDRLRHPLLAPLEGIVFVSHDEACLVMPHYERGDLRQWVAAHQGRADAGELVRSVMSQVRWFSHQHLD